MEEQDVLAASTRKSRQASLERTAVDEGQYRSCRSITDFSDGDDAWVQQGGFTTKPKMRKVVGTGRGMETLAPTIVEDEMPKQKKKKHESCGRDFTPSADSYDYTYSSSSEEEEKMESNSDLSREFSHGMFGWG